MKTSDAVKKMFWDYVLVQAEITLSFGIIGSIFAKNVRVPFFYFFLPAVLGFICILPCLITYFKDDMTINQIVIQRVIEWIIIVAAFEFMVWVIMDGDRNPIIYIVSMISITVFDVLTYLLSDMKERREVMNLNDKLKKINEEDRV